MDTVPDTVQYCTMIIMSLKFDFSVHQQQVPKEQADDDKQTLNNV